MSEFYLRYLDFVSKALLEREMGTAGFPWAVVPGPEGEVRYEHLVHDHLDAGIEDDCEGCLEDEEA